MGAPDARRQGCPLPALDGPAAHAALSGYATAVSVTLTHPRDEEHQMQYPTREIPGLEPNPARDADHARRIFELRLTGASMDDIADQLDISRATAFRLFDTYVIRLAKPSVEDARKIELHRLDRLLLALEPLLHGDDQRMRVAAAAEVRANSARRSMLLGLDTPTVQRHEVRTTDAVDEEIARLVREVEAKAAAETAP